MNNLPSHLHPPCAACKLLRRKCTPECVFAPYFPPDQPHKFSFVHRVYGASNVAKMISEVSLDQREDAVNSLVYEAEARLRDPVYGCVGFMSILQRRLKQLQTDLFVAKKHLSAYLGPQAMAPILQPHMVPSSSSSLNELQRETGIPPQSSQPLMVDTYQSLAQPFPVAAVGSREDQSHDMFLVNEGMEVYNNNNNQAGFVNSYGCNPMTMTMTMVSSEQPSSFLEGSKYQIQPQQSEGRISNIRIPRRLQQQFLAQPQPATEDLLQQQFLVQPQPETAELQMQQPPTSLLLQDAAETRTGLPNNIVRW